MKSKEVMSARFQPLRVSAIAGEAANMSRSTDAAFATNVSDQRE